MDAVLTALAEQHAELDELLAGLDGAGWATPTPACPGWTVADVALHLAQTDELGIASATGRLSAATGGLADRPGTVDDAAGAMVERERGDDRVHLEPP